MSVEGRFEEIGRKARRVQDAVDRVRGSATVAGVRIEVAADGRITALEMSDSVLAQAISSAHAQALAQAGAQVADLRRELAEDPTVASALRQFIAAEAEAPKQAVAQERSAQVPPRRDAAAEDWDDPDYENPYALPPDVRRRFGL